MPQAALQSTSSSASGVGIIEFVLLFAREDQSVFQMSDSLLKTYSDGPSKHRPYFYLSTQKKLL
jgi:hypothetical protein